MAENAPLQPWIHGNIEAVFRERNVLRLGSLVIYFGLDRDWRHFCFSGWFREGFSSDFVCWHHEMCGGNERFEAAVSTALVSSPAAVTNDYYRHVCTKSPCSMSDFYDLKTVVTHFEMALFECRSGSNLSGLGSHLWFRLWRVWNYSLLVRNRLSLRALRSERTSGLDGNQLCNFKSPFLTESKTKYILSKLLRMNKT